MIYRPQFAAHGRAKYSTSLTFVSDAALRSGGLAALELQKGLSAVKNTRKVSKHDLLWNDTLQKLRSIPRPTPSKPTAASSTCEPATVLPMAQRYFLF